MHDEALPASARSATGRSGPAGLPSAVYALALGLFLMGTTEFVVAGLLPEIAADVEVSLAQAGLLITVFAIGMVVGAPVMALATRRIPQRRTLMLALVVFALGHVVVAIGSSFAVLLAARFVTALATGAFWAVAAVTAARLAGPGASSRALGIVNAGGMLATVLGVPVGAFAGQVIGWRAIFWALAVLAVAAVVLIARQVPHNDPGNQSVSIRSELGALRSGRLWLVLGASAATTGAVFAAYSYIAPLLTDRAGISPGLIAPVLAGFGLGSVAGSVLGGRLGDTRPHAVTIVAPAATTLILLALVLVSGSPLPTVVLIVLFGLFGLGANPVLIALAVRYAGHAPMLGSSLSVAAFNSGTAAASWVGGIALESGFGPVGPVVVATVLAALTLVPTSALAISQRSRTPRTAPAVMSAAT
ncbi:MFS transporter [Georgenia subflava]|uniref:MFS transporter n=1 Tax=Georgenia subflava TaxID=1622177 RepID=A0A6N7EIR4_9MICO|nr:MFS transporter [Georgenia subflava]MPV38039.1 MFS transporter [Georgenia subflava]